MVQPDGLDTEQRTLDEERSWVQRAQRGDQDAFRRLVDAHRDRAYGLALRVLRSPADAEEVAQDSFVRAWTALPGFRGESRFGTWLYAIVARRALDRAVTLTRRRGREMELDAARETIGGGHESDAERARLALRMERSMERLTEAQRAVVALYYYEDRSVDEVAKALALPLGTVKTHLSRARATLREAWLREERLEDPR